MKPNDAVHRKAECTLRDHPTLRRWLTQPPATGRLSADRSQVAAEARRDAKYLLATSDPDLPAEDAAPGYKNVLERSVPLHDEVHALPAACLPPPGRADTRPRAAVPAGPCCRSASPNAAPVPPGTPSGTKSAASTRPPSPGPAGRLQQTTRITDAQAKLFKDCGVPPPPKMSGVQTTE